MKKIRVLHFELDENLGGIETFLLNLYKQIDRDNVQSEQPISMNLLKLIQIL